MRVGIELWLGVELLELNRCSNDYRQDQNEANAATKASLEEQLALVRQLDGLPKQIETADQLLGLLYFFCHACEEKDSNQNLKRIIFA